MEKVNLLMQIDIYEGEFKDHKKNSFGKLKSSNGDIKEGQWDDDEFVQV